MAGAEKLFLNSPLTPPCAVNANCAIIALSKGRIGESHRDANGLSSKALRQQRNTNMKKVACSFDVSLTH